MMQPEPTSEPEAPVDLRSRIAQLLGHVEVEAPRQPSVTFKQVDIVETPTEPPSESGAETSPPAMVVPPSLPMSEIVPPPLEEVPLAVAVEAGRAEDVSPLLEAQANSPSSKKQEANVSEPANEEQGVYAPRFPEIPSAAVMNSTALVELWEQECRAARRKLEPEGALTGATRELQAGLGAFLSVCHEHGVKVGPWRLQHVVNEWSYGDHPTYGVVTLAHWACKDSQPWKVGIGLFLARGAGKPKDLEVKLAVMDTEPAMVDHLILLRPEDDLVMTGKSKTLLQDAERRGKHARLEPVSLDGFAQLYAFPRWLAAVREGLPAGFPVPNLADVIQEKCEKLLEQVCMPVQG
jgi:hypothetical protein